MKRISILNSIVQYTHCKRCIEEMPAGYSPASWAQLSVGFTKIGIQVWCMRHEINVLHIDFQGAKHPASLLATNGHADVSYNGANTAGFQRGRFTKHRPDPSKVIGLAKLVGGGWEPTNDESRARFDLVCRREDWAGLAELGKLTTHELKLFSNAAKRNGYKVVTTLRAVYPGVIKKKSHHE